MQRLYGKWLLGNFEDLKEGHITGGRVGGKCMVRLEAGKMGRSQAEMLLDAKSNRKPKVYF